MNAHIYIYICAEGWSKFNELNEVDEFSHWSSHAFSFYAGKTVAALIFRQIVIARRFDRSTRREIRTSAGGSISFICLLIKIEIKHKCIYPARQPAKPISSRKVIWRNGNTYTSTSSSLEQGLFYLRPKDCLALCLSSVGYQRRVAQSR